MLVYILGSGNNDLMMRPLHNISLRQTFHVVSRNDGDHDDDPKDHMRAESHGSTLTVEEVGLFNCYGIVAIQFCSMKMWILSLQSGRLDFKHLISAMFSLSLFKEALEMDAILTLFRQQNMTPNVKTHILVRRREILRSAFKALSNPSFSFRTTPVLHYIGEEDHDGSLREFFRSASTFLPILATSIIVLVICFYVLFDDSITHLPLVFCLCSLLFL